MLENKLETTKAELEKLLLNIIDNSRKIVDNSLFENNPSYLSDVNNIIENYQRNIFLLIDLEKYINYFNLKENDKEIINGIIVILKAFKNNKFAKLPLDIRKSINNNEVMKKYITSIEKSKNDYETNSSCPSLLQEILDNIQSLDGNSYIEDLDMIFNILREVKIDLKLKIEINKLICNYNIIMGQIMANHDYSEDEFIDKVVSYRISYEELKELFEKYNYNLDLLDKDLIEKLLLLGDLDNIDYLFSWYKKQGLKISEEKKSDEKYFHLLYKSDRNVIERMTEVSEELNVNLIQLFTKSFSAFMHKTSKEIKNLHKIVPPKPGDGNSLFGSHEDFLANKVLLKDCGYDINEAYRKCPSIFVYSNKKLKENVKALEKYGINVKENHDNIKLSGLKSKDILLTIDKFIELDEFDYLLNNTSRLQLSPDHVIFYRIYKAKKQNIDIKSSKHEGTYKSFITQDLSGKKFVSTERKHEDTNTIIPKIFPDVTNELLEQSYNISNSVISTDILESSIVSKLDELYLRDNQLIYYIDDIKISKYKVIRLLSALKEYFETLDKNDLLVYCITYNSILSENEFNRIKNKISVDFNKKGLVYEIS